MGRKYEPKSHWNISDFKFSSLEIDEQNEDKNEVKLYELKELGQYKKIQEELQKPKIKREIATSVKMQFEVAPIVDEHRGLRKIREEEYEERVKSEVAKRVQAQREVAYEEGLKLGIEKAYKETQITQMKLVEEKLEQFSEFLENAAKNEVQLFVNQKNEIYQLVRKLVKWIVLRELSADGKYIERLLEKLLLELQSKSNLLIKVNPESFIKMPEVLELVQEKLGKLTNVRIETDEDMVNSGIVIESENGIIDGTLNSQFENLDKLFEGVEIYE